jgi:hypothetical protein
MSSTTTKERWEGEGWGLKLSRRRWPLDGERTVVVTAYLRDGVSYWW